MNVKEICSIVDGPVKVEVTGLKMEQMVKLKNWQVIVSDKLINRVSLKEVLTTAGITSSSIYSWKNNFKRIASFNLLILDEIPEQGADLIPSFVSNGGICWILHQEKDKCLSFLPKKLSSIKLMNRYELVAGETEMEYVGPWIMDREHPLWNNPAYIDEAFFVFWNFKIESKNYKTSATHVLLPSKDWHIIAGFVDHKISLKDRGALVMESRHGKGLYFWTQILPPQIFWKKRGSFERSTWEIFLGNIINYFRGFPDPLRIKVNINPWALMAGSKAKIEVSLNKEVKIKNIGFKVNKDKKSFPLSLSNIKKDTRTYRSFYVPQNSGTYQIKVMATTEDKKRIIGWGFFKVTKGCTPFRFFTHTHFENSYVPESLGLVFGVCRRLGIDGVVLACGTFAHNPTDRDYPHQSLKEEELKLIDNPQVRFFPGEEIHPHHRYTEKEGLPEDSPEPRRHASTLGCYNLYPYSTDYWKPENLVKIHKNKGLAIVCHPYKDPWWTKSQNGHNFEAVEFDRCDTTVWDKVLKRGDMVTGVSGIDNAGGLWWLPLRGANTGWFDEPFNPKNLFKTILKGRITKFNTYPLPFRAKNTYLWFDINNQMVGGTLYTANKVKIHIKIKSHLPIQQIYLVKGGKRNYRNLEPNRKFLDIFIEDKVEEDTYYRLEVNHDKTCAPYCVSSLTNPIFVKKIPGPPESSFYFTNSSQPVFDNKKGRWVLDYTKVSKVKFANNVWQIELFEPSSEGKLFICREGNITIIPFLRGKHTIVI